MIPTPWRLIGVAVVLLAAFFAGVYVTTGHFHAQIAKQRAADQQAVSDQLSENAQTLRNQIQVNQDTEAKYAQLQNANMDANAHLHDLLRQYAALSSAVPTAPKGPGSSNAGAEVSDCSSLVSGLVEHEAPVFDAAREDALQLAQLQAWISASGLQ